MSQEIKAAFAKLAGIARAVERLLDDEHARKGLRPIQNYPIDEVARYFEGAVTSFHVLRQQLPALYADFPELFHEPNVRMGSEGTDPPRFGRAQIETLARDIQQIFEIRAHSEVQAPRAEDGGTSNLVFLSHGRASDWREVQAFVERDLGLSTLELEQQPNLGRTVLQKLWEESAKCGAAIIVMTADDLDADGQARARENVIHEIGLFQGRFGLSRICILHEEGVNIPSNIGGLVYAPFTRGNVKATFGLLQRELRAMLA